MSEKRREKFQDSNALIQLSRQLRSKQVAENAVATRESSTNFASRAQQPAIRAGSCQMKLLLIALVKNCSIQGADAEDFACPTASLKRQKSLSSDERASVQVKAKRQKKVPASAQQLEVFPAGQTLQNLNEAAVSVQTHTAAPSVQWQQPAGVQRDKPINKQAPIPRCDLVSWYANVCTQGFAGELSALQRSQDSGHAQPSLLSRCIRMNSTLFEGKQQVLHSLPWQTHVSLGQHVNYRL